MIRLLTLLVLLLSGCGGSEVTNNNHGYGDYYDVRGDSGLALRYSPTFDQNDPLARVSRYETEFNEVMACTGITAPPPMVIVKPNGSLRPYDGYYYPDPDLIVVEPGTLTVTFKHELVHYLLDRSTGDLDPHHKSYLFLKCSSHGVT